MLQRWDPFNELRRMEDTMDRLWRGFVGRDLASAGGELEAWAPPLDVVDEADKITVNASLPGIKPDDIEVSIENSVLTIKGQTKAEEEKREANYIMRERRAGSFYRAIRLPDSVDADKAESTYEQGVLSIVMPKVEAKRARLLQIKAAK